MKRLLNIYLFLAMIMACSEVSAQTYDLSPVRNAISRWQALRGCAFGESRGVLAWYGTNGYQCASIYNQISNIIEEINSKKRYIDYVSLADNGNYVIISNNGNTWHACGPTEFFNALNETANNGGIKSATIDQFNCYFILGRNGSVKTNNDSWRTFYNTKKQSMGGGRSAWSSGGALVVCFDKGVDFIGTVPTVFYNKIKELDFVPDFAQFGKSGNYVFSTNGGRSVYRLNNYGKYETAPGITVTPSVPVNNNPSPAYYPVTPTMPTTYPCGVCNSSGKCLHCGGTGISRNHAPGIVANCGYCGGTGLCPTCGGKGYN